MKKLVVILLMVVYGAASLGSTVHVHYCMDKLIEWGMVNCESDMCNHKGAMKGMDDDKCCKHLYEQVKVANHYKDAATAIDFNKFIVIANLIFPHQDSFTPVPIPIKNYYSDNNCLRKPNNKIYILNCVYRI